MKIKVFDNEEDLYNYAAKIFINEVKTNPNTHLGLATGSTPIKLYQLLVEDYKKNKTDYSNVKTFNLDEYAGLDKTHAQSYYTFMHNQLFNHINIKKENINIPNGKANNLNKEAETYGKLLIKEGINLQLLGIGTNGHIAFNEPGSPLDGKCSLVDLTKNTIKDNSRFFKNINEVPKKAISVGIGDILKSKKIVLIAVGKHKAEAIKKTVNVKPTTKCPASALNNHKETLILLDKDAASLL